MASDPPTLLGMFAHPDDELSMGGCYARYTASGVRAVLACATRGDGPDAKISDPALATPQTLGEVRTRELACACRELGIAAPLFLGWQDGSVDQVDPEAGMRLLVRLIRELRPQVVVTHGPEGGYGHPDHVALGRMVTHAWERADDVNLEPEGPLPYAPAKLYYTAFPRSFTQLIPGMANRRADIRGQQLPFMGVPDEDITTAVDVAEALERKDRARACHATQFVLGPDGKPRSFFSSLPDEERRKYMSRENFVLARWRGITAHLPESDLFAGLAA